MALFCCICAVVLSWLAMLCPLSWLEYPFAHFWDHLPKIKNQKSSKKIHFANPSPIDSRNF